MTSSLILLLLLAFAAFGSATKPFIGRFVTTGQRENTVAFAKAVGMEDETRRIFNEFLDKGNGDYVYKFSVENDEYKQELPFKLGEQRQATYDDTDFTYKFYEEGDQLKFDSQLLPDGRQVSHSYTFEAPGFVKTYKSKDVVAKVWFKKE